MAETGDDLDVMTLCPTILSCRQLNFRESSSIILSNFACPAQFEITIMTALSPSIILPKHTHSSRSKTHRLPGERYKLSVAFKENDSLIGAYNSALS